MKGNVKAEGDGKKGHAYPRWVADGDDVQLQRSLQVALRPLPQDANGDQHHVDSV